MNRNFCSARTATTEIPTITGLRGSTLSVMVSSKIGKSFSMKLRKKSIPPLIALKDKVNFLSFLRLSLSKTTLNWRMHQEEC
jgi:hypothetical protein